MTWPLPSSALGNYDYPQDPHKIRPINIFSENGQGSWGACRKRTLGWGSSLAWGCRTGSQLQNRERRRHCLLWSSSELPVLLLGTSVNSLVHQARLGWNCFFRLSLVSFLGWVTSAHISPGKAHTILVFPFLRLSFYNPLQRTRKLFLKNADNMMFSLLILSVTSYYL